MFSARSGQSTMTRSAFLLPRGEGIAPGIGEAALQVGRIEAAPSEPLSGRAWSSRRPSRRSSFRASGSTPRVGVNIEDPQRSPISLSSNSQGDSASSSHKRPRSSGDILPESSCHSSSRDRSKKQKLVGDGSARAIGVDLVGRGTAQVVSSSLPRRWAVFLVSC
ncbi:hypothetical protein Bca4012_019605 [Brassica carinata]